MVEIDIPPQYFQNRAIFKRRPEGGKRFQIPEVEREALGIRVGDDVDVRVYSPVDDVIMRETRTVRQKGRITIKKSLRPEGGISDELPSQLVLHKESNRRVDLLSNLSPISPKFFFNKTVYKRSPRINEIKGGGTLNIPQEEVEVAGIEAGDTLNVMLIEVTGVSNVPLRKRSVIRVKVFEIGRRSLGFNIRKGRVELKGFTEDSIIQVLVFGS